MEPPQPFQTPERSMLMGSARGAAAVEQPIVLTDTAAAPKPMDVEEQLEQEWSLLGRPAGYEAPPQ